jgi:hypothetical protein
LLLELKAVDTGLRQFELDTPCSFPVAREPGTI